MFNTTNIVNSVFPTLSDRNQYSMLPQFTKSLNIFIQHEFGYLKDSLILTSSKTVSFYSALNIQENLQSLTDDTYMNFNFKKDSQSTIYERRV
jgi:hypothetical protein